MRTPFPAECESLGKIELGRLHVGLLHSLDGGGVSGTSLASQALLLACPRSSPPIVSAH